ncbi:MAG: cyanophycinase [Chloroflexi bacterium]|nr:cyanophycinase [Chloroflexota bacterium]
MTVERGYLLPIGGAEDKIAARVILTHFVQRCGGTEAIIIVIPTASEIPEEVGPMYKTLFDALGVQETRILDIRTREDADNPASSAVLEGATGIFLTGGDQLRLATILDGSLTGDSIQQAFAAGVNIAGTSAGASAMSYEMIAAGQSGMVPSPNLVEMGRGLGLTHEAIIDQHFRQRTRIGRLITVVMRYPHLLGIGLDEDTALEIAPDNACQVIGSGSVMIVDASQLLYTDIHEVAPDRLVSALGVTVHILTHGYRYHLDTRQPSPADLTPEKG